MQIIAHELEIIYFYYRLDMYNHLLTMNSKESTQINDLLVMGTYVWFNNILNCTLDGTVALFRSEGERLLNAVEEKVSLRDVVQRLPLIQCAAKVKSVHLILGKGIELRVSLVL